MVDINAIHDINSIVGAEVAVNSRPKSIVEVEDTPKPVAVAEKRSINTETVKRISSDISEVLSSINVQLVLEVDNDSGKVIVKVIDPETKEIIKQIPSKEMLRVGKRVAKLLSNYGISKNTVVSIFKDSVDTKVE